LVVWFYDAAATLPYRIDGAGWLIALASVVSGGSVVDFAPPRHTPTRHLRATVRRFAVRGYSFLRCLGRSFFHSRVSAGAVACWRRGCRLRRRTWATVKSAGVKNNEIREKHSARRSWRRNQVMMSVKKERFIVTATAL
jgi:hypothetical protein